MVLMSDSATVMVYLKKERDMVSQDVRTASGNYRQVKTVYGELHGKILSGEDHSCGPVKSSGSDPSHRVVPSSLGTREHYTQANTKPPIYVSLIPDPLALKEDAFQYP